MKSSMKNLAVLALSAMKLSQEAVVAQAVVPGDYIGGFRLRLYWEEGYDWQESGGEKFWCMECDGSCEDGDKMRIDNCNSSKEQRFIFGAKTIHPSSNPSLCLTTDGSGSDDPIKLRSCNNSSKQNFQDLKKNGRFELKPEDMNSKCVSQKHHPKAKEPIYPESCDKTRDTKTTYWITF